MTQFPDAPAFVATDGSSPTRTLAEDHVTEVALCFGLYRVKVTLKAGFSTDGASVPESLRPAAGGPWEMPRLLAAVVHDGLYQRHWKWRWLCDRVYLAVLRKAGYSPELADFEYAAVRAAGGKNWNAVTKEERRIARRDVVVETGGVLS